MRLSSGAFFGVSLSFAVALLVACGTASRDEAADTKVSNAIPLDAAADASVWGAKPDSKSCNKLKNYKECHVCCIGAYPAAMNVPWEALRTCACRLAKPPCQTECKNALCAPSFPFVQTSRACRACIGESAQLGACYDSASSTCYSDRECTAGGNCDVGCPEAAPGEDIEAEDLLTDGG